MRVSIISAREDTYQSYYRGNYKLADVKASITYAKAAGVYVSLNMLFFPGLNDREEEVAAWKEFLADMQIDMIQLRNLNIDPDAFLAIMPKAQGEMIGTKNFIKEIKQSLPQIVIGSFSHYIEK